jgi:hypothetical protein
MLLCVQRNYRLYLLLISLALVFYAYTMAFSVRRIIVQLDVAAGAGLLGLLRSWPEMVALAAFSSVAVWLLACLLAYHVFLAAKNQVKSSESSCDATKEPPGVRMIHNVLADKLLIS